MNKIKSVLSNHGVIAFPTETVCGLGIYYDDKIAFEKLNKIKGERNNKPYTLMLADVNDISKYATLNDLAKSVIEGFMPGEITILVKAKDNLPNWVTLSSPFVGIRVSSHELTKEVIKKGGKPLLVPSLNRSGQKPFIDIEKAKEYFMEEIDHYIFGVADGKKPSTIVKIDDTIEIVRQGDISLDEIMEYLGRAK